MNEDDKAEPTVELVESPGETLRKAREKYGLSEQDVATELNLSVSQVRALEENRFHELPGETYIRGYLKSYARLLDTDEKDILQNFNQQGNATITGIRPVMKETRSSDRHMKLLTLGVIAVLGGLMFMWWQNREETSFVQLITVDGPSEPDAPKAGKTEPPAQTAATTRSYEIERSEVVPTIHDAAPTRVVDSDLAPGDAAGAAVQGDETAPVTGTAAQTRGPGVVQLETPSQTEPASPTAVSVEGQPPVAPAAVQPAPEQQVSTGNSAAPPAPTASASTAREQSSPRVVAGPPPGNEVKLQVSVTSWVDLRDADGQRLVYENVNPGREILVQGKPPFSVFLGNAEGVRVEYAGKPFDFGAYTNGIYARFQLGPQSAGQSN